MTGVNRGVIANRVSYHLGLRGPSLTVDTGAVVVAGGRPPGVQSLRVAASRALAIAGGVQPESVADGALATRAFGGLSPDGRCFTFDARANGFVRGEGGGGRRAQAAGAGRRGRRPGLRRHPGQRREQRRCDGWSDRARALPPRSRFYGRLPTGRDRARRRPVRRAARHRHPRRRPGRGGRARRGARRRRRRRPLLVGSVKTNVGHLEGAAGHRRADEGRAQPRAPASFRRA